MTTTRGWRRWAIAGAALGLACTAMAAEQMPARRTVPTAPADEARVIVKFRASSETVRAAPLDAVRTAARAESMLQARAEALGGRTGARLSAGRAISDRAQVVTASGLDSHALARKLRADADVEYAEVDQLRTWLAVPNDPLYGPAAGTSPASGQWYLKAPVAPVLASINAPGAWDITTGKTGIVVAVLDTGIRKDHPDLAGQLLSGYDMVLDTTIANDGSGRDDDPSDPGDYITAADARTTKFSGCTVSDSSWHGTQVAGLVGAAWNNGIGMAGLAPGVKVLPVRVLGKCGGYDSDIVAGMRWAAGLTVAGVPANANPARVLNMSLGGDGACTSVYSDAVNEVTNAGAVVVVAAGNSSGHAVSVPANCTGVVAVAGLRHIGTKVGFSDVGPEVTISAPGGNCVNETGSCLYPILSTTNAGKTTPVANSAAYTDGTNYAVGTSFSAPLVSGTVALMLSADASLTPAQVKTVLRSTARAFPSTGAGAGVAACHAPNGVDQVECYCTTSTCGAGMLDVAAAVQKAGHISPSGNVEAVVTASPARPDPGNVVTLSMADTLFGLNRGFASASWSIVSGGDIVQGFEDGNTGPSVTVKPSGNGTFTVRVNVVDDQGGFDTADLTVVVDELSVTVSPVTSSLKVGETATIAVDELTTAPDRKVTYVWSIVQGNGLASLSGMETDSAITVVAKAAGTVKVRVTVTNDLGKQVAADWTGTISAATPVGTSSTDSGSGGGGGAMSLFELLCGVVLLVVLKRARRRRA
ncbi:S8 family serine peptidase [Piscinibacter gummiphilus]|uniref:S8 family serine peptidase n=1 Tax=Piscinibacter gummiphilus TaxID=946333 RepID=UPI000A271ABA|nr:S8 family serine peptidase [Piscinibacter gummiphilus]